VSTVVTQYAGVEVVAGGRTLVLPALTLGAMKRLRKEFAVIAAIDATTQGGTLTDEQIDAMLSLVAASAVRNYPGMTRDDLAELVDLANLPIIIPAILGQSGFRRVAPGEAGSP